MRKARFDPPRYRVYWYEGDTLRSVEGDKDTSKAVLWQLATAKHQHGDRAAWVEEIR